MYSYCMKICMVRQLTCIWSDWYTRLFFCLCEAITKENTGMDPCVSLEGFLFTVYRPVKNGKTSAKDEYSIRGSQAG